MERPLAGTAALVTGASSGIGAATARRLAELGAAVAIVSRRGERLRSLAGQIAGAGGQAVVVPADVGNPVAADGAVEAAVDRLGRLDVLVNAAGLMLVGPTADSTVDDWDRMIRTNLAGLLHMTRAALPHLLCAAASATRGVSDVVNISSIGGRFPRANSAVYNATKFAVTGATEAWRQEFTQRNVRFTVIEPGAVNTELFEALPPAARQQVENMFARQEILQAEDAADAVGYAISRTRHVSISEIVIRPTDQV